MSRKKKIDLEEDGAEYRFASWLKQCIDMMQPKDLFLVIGRAGGKTTDIVAERMMDVVHDLPGAFIAFVGDTYLNLQKNVVPSVLEGWNKKGWVEGIHYVVDKRPPEWFKKPYKPVFNFKHTITTWNGCFFKLVSMDRPSNAAGDSYQHIAGDEAKYLKESKLAKLTPAIRGEFVRFGHSPYYRGRTFTTDMPNITHGEHDWILNMSKNIDKEQITQILQVADVYNECKKEYIAAKREGGKTHIALAEKRMQQWEKRWRKVRKNSLFFYIASSYINSDILTPEFFIDSLRDLGVKEFLTAIGSLEPTLEKGSMFYPAVGPEHYYADSYIYEDYYDKFQLGHPVAESSQGLKYIDHTSILEGGMDAGNMMSLIIAQVQGENARILKNFYTLPPAYIPELAKEFLRFFEHHSNKTLHLYYDRSANNNRRINRDVASELKREIEYQDEKPTGWYVKLMSENQGDITHATEFDLAMKAMTGTVPGIPKLLIDRNECRELKSAMEKAPVIIQQVGLSKTIKKDKRSEKKLAATPARLPMESTNMTDAFKYWLCRKSWIDLANRYRNEQKFELPKFKKK